MTIRKFKTCVYCTLLLLPLVVHAQTRQDLRTGATAAAAPAAPPAESPELSDPMATSITAASAMLGPGDLIEISVFDTPELTQKVRVTSEGKIALALIGEIEVNGMTAEQLRTLIARQLMEGRFVRKPQVSVLVTGYAGQVAYVDGEVNRPGAYPLLRSHRLRDLIAVAGGPGAKAGNMATVSRAGGDKPLQVDLSNTNDLQDNPEIYPGDHISIAQAGIIYVLGEVGRPGGFLLDRHSNITLLNALALAEGLQSSASIKKATLLRKHDGASELMAINIHKILTGEQADIPMVEGDILYINGSLTRGLGRTAIVTMLATASTAAVYVAALH